ncbi:MULTISPECIES: response regulator transcription factor [Clostridium]|uniref:response regulator transcription factor n=1 Tax=Clostridium TaxID=1485 RepID=UPI000666822F|nr:MULTISPECIES: response regulator transcription factor [Clostridium]MDB2075603.1 response regulator transcription factor [Clostridium paraputrificum]MDB2079870.1 response regulator transcription factor [Clostridium paraputrificum]MDB2086733.1 response regulator transcription factor [Clostridium paraputrificum]MDB2092827.1 response regulator transcription factor [Clostridium paraputrificum]MDB2099800.1 response regulator transcription factor [Clostridium paraputrificum]
MGYKILICDDEKEILELIELYLGKEGYSVVKANDGQEALEKVKNDTDFDLAIVDIMMPRVDGYRVIKEIRKLYNIPIIMLSAKNQDSDKILGLDLGADDYITKPFNPLELVARVNAQIRRVYKLSAKENACLKIVIGDIELDTYNVKLIVRGKEVEVTSIEYGILKYLMENAGRILTKNQIFEAVWNEAFLSGDNTIMVHISRLRDKIEEDSRNPVYLKTVRGLGYKFEKR